MCFSSTASFVAGGALSATGIYTLSKAKTNAELPLAGIPLLFGIQQAIEGIIWITFGSPVLNTLAVYVYSLFSHSLWPVYVPIAVLLIETNNFRKWILRVFSLIGLAVGSYLFYIIITIPVTAQIINKSIAYQSASLYTFTLLGAYLIATCGSCLMSSHKYVKLFGVVLLISFAVSARFFIQAFFSVWCFLAAILSFTIYMYFKK